MTTQYFGELHTPLTCSVGPSPSGCAMVIRPTDHCLGHVYLSFLLSPHLVTVGASLM